MPPFRSSYSRARSSSAEVTSVSRSSSKISSSRLSVIGSSADTKRIASIRGLSSSAVIAYRFLSGFGRAPGLRLRLGLGRRLGLGLALVGLDVSERADLHDPNLQ